MKAVKQKRIILFLFAALGLLLAAALFSACDRSEPAPFSTAPIYDINMFYDSSSHTVTARQEVLVPANFAQGQDRVIFNLYANIISEENDIIDILSVKINRKTVDFEICGQNNDYLEIPAESSEDMKNISLEYSVRIPAAAARLGYGEGYAALGHFYPSLAVYDGEWKISSPSAVGDPFFCECSDFYVSLTLDSSLSVAASGKTSLSEPFTRDGLSLCTAEISAENIRDFGLVVGDFKFAEAETKSPSQAVSVQYFYRDDPDPAASLERAVSAIETFGAAFGEYLYETFRFAQLDLAGAGGMEYGAFATVSPAPRETYLDAIAHEIAHQWWYSAVGSDQLGDAWLDEGLSEFCTYFYHSLAGDPAAFRAAMDDVAACYNDFVCVMRPTGFDASMRRPLSSYISNGEYVAVNYQKGALLFHHLYSVVGEKKFVASLKEYYAANRFAVATPYSLAAAFKTQGFDISPILNGWLNDKNK